MSTYHYFVSIVFLDFYDQCFRFFTSYDTYNNLFQGIVKTLENLYMFSICGLSKQFQQVLLLLASIHSLVITQGLVLILFNEKVPVNRNQFDDLLCKLPEWFLCDLVSYVNGFISSFMSEKASFITVISTKIYFCYNLDQRLL